MCKPYVLINHPRTTVDVGFRDICSNIKKVMTITGDDPTMPTHVEGATLKVKFDLAGPGANICPKCSLFIGTIVH